MIDAEELLQITAGNPQQSMFKLGRIDPAYSGSGRPKVVFDGETTASGKQYPYLSIYTPAANDRILLAAVAGSYVILGKIM